MSSQPVMNAPTLLIKSTRILACLGAGTLFLTRELQTGYFVVYGVLLLFGFAIERFGQLLSIASRVQPVFALLSLALAVVDFLKGSQSFLLVVAHFLLSIQGLRLLALKTTRDNLGSVLLSSLMMVSAATLSVDWTFFLLLVAYVPCVIWTLMVHNLAFENEQVLKDNSERQPNAVWSQSIPVIKRAAFVAFGVTFVCCALIFVFFPRFNFQGFRGQFLQPVVKTGLSNVVDLTDSGTIYEDESIVMRIEIPRKPEDWDGYLRGQTLVEFNGSEWKRVESQPNAVYGTRGVVSLAGNLSPADLARWPRWTVYLESMDTPMLFLPTHTVAIDIERPFLFRYPDGGVHRVPRDTWRVRYDVIHSPTRDALAQRVIPDNTALSLGPLVNSTEFKAFVDRLVGQERNPLQIARLLEAHLASTYQYTLEIPVSTRDQPIESFLYDHKKGHCEYFSSALALMFRAKGIPARIVTGFLSKEWNERGHYVVVRSRHAHAWVEGYFADQGWVRFDPSPRDNVDVRPPTWWRRHVSELVDNVNLAWNRYVLSYDMERQVGMLMAFNRKSKNMATKIDFPRFSWSFKRNSEQSHRAEKPPLEIWPLMIFLGSMGVVVGLLFWWRLRTRHLREVVRRTLVTIYQSLGVSSPHLTFQEQYDRAQFKSLDQAQSVRFLVEAYDRLRYDPHFVPSADFIVDVKKQLRMK